MAVRIVELFAGVGGFRLGFEGQPGQANRERFRVVFSNQWEPSTKRQHAAEVYANRWEMEPVGESMCRYQSVVHANDVFLNEDIASIPANQIPEHDLLCGGFPCQDYSVAKTLDKSVGLSGKKGVLWWEIHRIAKHHLPRYLLLENVDRLLGSPKAQRGKDFAVMLASLDDLGYTVEWRVIDASEYGFPQRRKRVFIFARLASTHELDFDSVSSRKVLESDGLFAKAFPVHPLEVISVPQFALRKSAADDLSDVSSMFNSGRRRSTSPFANSGVMANGNVFTCKTRPKYHGERQSLGDILVKPGKIKDEFILTPSSILKEKGWMYLKGGKKETRTTSDGYQYKYSEGPITFPDDLRRASRTIITGEGGRSPSRFKHVVKFRPTKSQFNSMNLECEDAQNVRASLGLQSNEWLRRLMPIELERLNGFPDDHTGDVAETKRAFFMGNALVVGIVERIARILHEI